MEPDERRLVDWLDGPRIAFGGLIAFLLVMSLFGLKLYSDQQQQVEQIQVLLQANRDRLKASNEDQVRSCFASATQAPAISRLLHALEMEARSEPTREALRNYSDLNDLNASTIRECRQLAKDLHVPIPKGVR